MKNWFWGSYTRPITKFPRLLILEKYRIMKTFTKRWRCNQFHSSITKCRLVLFLLRARSKRIFDMFPTDDKLRATRYLIHNEATSPWVNIGVRKKQQRKVKEKRKGWRKREGMAGRKVVVVVDERTSMYIRLTRTRLSYFIILYSYYPAHFTRSAHLA